MKHTSIRLSEEHAVKIADTKKSPTVIIKKALDLYFDIPSEDLEPARKLIEEHVRTCHSSQYEYNTSTRARIKHSMSSDIKHVVSQNELQSAQAAHKVSTEMPIEQAISIRAQDEHIVNTAPCDQDEGVQSEHNANTDLEHNAPVPVPAPETKDAQSEHVMGTEARQALSLILEELKGNHEPLVNEIANKMSLNPIELGRILATCGIAAKKTRSHKQPVTIFPRFMRGQIEEILSKE
jgi:hypothetical protein